MQGLVSSKFLALKNYLSADAAATVLLLLASLAAVFLANSNYAQTYSHWVHILHFGVNDGLMAVFFLLMGLEIKREFVAGSLDHIRSAALPVFAAIGGIVVPAVVFLLFNMGQPAFFKGWAIPTATDIAFAMAALAVFGRYLDSSLKVILLSIAIIDDLAAIVIIALFYTATINTQWLLLALVPLLLMMGCNTKGVTALWVYVILGFFLWVCFLQSGIHATLAGVLTAFAVPMFKRGGTGHSPVKTLQHALHGPVGFVVLPLFGFVNAGVSLAGFGSNVLSPLTLGVAFGLFVGKPIGVLGGAWLGEKLGLAKRLYGLTWANFWIVAHLCGIGFTMSLFIGGLAFATEPSSMDHVRIGVILGSVLSFVTAWVLYLRLKPH